MKISTEKSNTCNIELPPNKAVYFNSKYLSSGTIGKLFSAFKHRGAWLSRLRSGVLFFHERRTAVTDESEVVSLGGSEPQEKFIHIAIPKGSSYSVNLYYLAAYSFEEGGGFASRNQIFNPSAWLVGLARITLVQGPAEIILYGRGLSKGLAPNSSIHSHQVILFKANEEVELEAYDPKNSLLNCIINALSSNVMMRFQPGADIIHTTTKFTETKGRRFYRFFYCAKLLFGVGLTAILVDDIDIFSIFK